MREKWPIKVVDSLCEVITKGTTPTTLGYEFSETGVPFLRVQNIVDGGIDYSRDALYIDDVTNSALSRSVVKPGDVLISIAGTIGRSGIVPEDAPALNCNQAVAILRLKHGVDRSFLRSWLSSFDAQKQIRSCVVTGTISNLSLSQLGNLKIPLPPLPEQRRIAAILDKSEALRAKRRAALAKLDTLAQSIFLEMFGDPATNPLGFVVSSLGDVCDVRDGTHDSPKYVQNNGYPLVTSRNISGGIVDLSGANLISESDYQQINKRSKVDIGDILMPMIGTIGSPVIVLSEPKFAIKNIALIKFGNNSLANSTFIHALLSSSYFDRIIETNNRGGTQKFLSLGDIRSIKTPLPPLPLQQAFARRVEAIEVLKERQRASLAKLDALFASLQDRAFKGEL